MTQFPPAPGSPGFPGTPGLPPQMPPNTDGKVKAPAIALMIVGGLAALFLLFRLTMILLQGQTAITQQIDQMRRAGAPENILRIMQTSSSLAPFVLGILVLFNLFTVFGGLRMLYRKAWGLAVFAAILQCIPCISATCCFRS